MSICASSPGWSEPVVALVTGFEPFDGDEVNASWEAVRSLPEELPLAGGSLRLHREPLPVTFTGAPARVAQLIDAVRPDVVVHVGLARTATSVLLESRAINEAKASIPDNDGVCADGGPIVASGPSELSSRWHAPALAGRLTAGNHRVEVSDDAGRYVCNATLYTTLALLDSCDPDGAVLGGFVHVPDQHRLPTEELVDVLLRLLTDLADQVRRGRARRMGHRRTVVPRPPQRPMRVGLTGGIGAGKTTLAAALARRGAHLVDADALAHEALAPGSEGLERVREAFGPDVLTPNGRVDRSALAAVVFADPGRRSRLEEIALPWIARTAAERMERAGPAAVSVYDVPLLVEQGMADLFDAVVVVQAPLSERVKRLIRRGVDAQEAQRRMRAQADDAERAAVADFVVVNDAGAQDLESAAAQLWAGLTEGHGRGSRGQDSRGVRQYVPGVHDGHAQ